MKQIDFGWTIYYLYYLWEINSLVAGTARKQFNKIIDTTKDLDNAIPQMIPNKKVARFIYACITIVELNIAKENNINKIFDFLKSGSYPTAGSFKDRKH